MIWAQERDVQGMRDLNRTKGPCLGEGVLCYSVAPRGLSPVAASGSFSLLRASHCVGFSGC